MIDMWLSIAICAVNGNYIDDLFKYVVSFFVNFGHV